jgi:tetratricopeptide (TPR) repeat protein
VRLNPNLTEAREFLEKARREIAKENLGLKPTSILASTISQRTEQSSALGLDIDKNSLEASPSSLRAIALRPAPSPALASSPAEPKTESSRAEPVIQPAPKAVVPAAPTPAAAPTHDTNARPAALPTPVLAAKNISDKTDAAPIGSGKPVTKSTDPTKGNPSITVVPKPSPASEASGKLDAQSAAAHNQRGRDLIQQGKYREAVDELTAALNAKPEFALALNARGFAYVLLKDWPRATADLDAALRLDPNYANAYQNRSFARKGSGDAPGAAIDEAKWKELTTKK